MAKKRRPKQLSDGPSPADAPAEAVALPREAGGRRASVFLWMLKICFFVGASLYLPYWDDLVTIGPTGINVRGYVLGYAGLALYFGVEAFLYGRRISR